MDEYRYQVTISRRDRSGNDLVSLLEGLRYDQARVITWDRAEDDRVIVTLASKSPSFERWHSFGIIPKAVL